VLGSAPDLLRRLRAIATAPPTNAATVAARNTVDPSVRPRIGAVWSTASPQPAPAWRVQ